MAVGNTGADQKKAESFLLTLPFRQAQQYGPKNRGHAVVCTACPLRVRQVMSGTMISEDV